MLVVLIGIHQYDHATISFQLLESAIPIQDGAAFQVPESNVQIHVLDKPGFGIWAGLINARDTTVRRKQQSQSSFSLSKRSGRQQTFFALQRHPASQSY